MCYNLLRTCMLTSVAIGAVTCLSVPALAQATDPGPRPLTAAQVQLNTAPKTALSLSQEGFVSFDQLTTDFFNAATDRFQEVDSVSGGITGQFPEAGSGLGPRFNSNSCASCHVFPTVGGTSPPGNFVTTDASGRTITGNPLFSVAKLDGATNTVPTFVTPDGPVREARFPLNPDGTRDGGVHLLFTITGRSDAGNCKIAQPDFATQLANRNIIFRIPTPAIGLGLVDNVPDGDQDNTIGLVGAANAQATLRSNLGIGGTFNRSDDGTITKFGWKAQAKSLLLFSGEAYNVEQGVTNELFPTERDDTANCRFNALPEDTTNVARRTPNSASPSADFNSDAVMFAAFMRLVGPPLPATPFNASQSRGQTVFFNIGCGACHIQTQTTSTLSFTNTTTAQSPVTFQPFSDFQLHDMGAKLRDRIFQGNAEGDQFRSAPLWGVGQRIFFLHDGRTSDLKQAILEHFSTAPTNPGNDPTPGSEANQVINNFNALSVQDQQNLLNFLRAL